MQGCYNFVSLECEFGKLNSKILQSNPRGNPGFFYSFARDLECRISNKHLEAPTVAFLSCSMGLDDFLCSPRIQYISPRWSIVTASNGEC